MRSNGGSMNYDSERSVGQFVKHAKKLKPLKIEEEQELAVLCQQGDTEAMWRLVAHNIMFAVKVAYTQRRRHVVTDDLVSTAVMAMYTAAKKFKPLGSRFISYAVWDIRAALNNYIVNNTYAVTLPNHTGEGLVLLRKFIEMGGDPDKATDQEIRDALGVPDTRLAIKAALTGGKLFSGRILSLNDLLKPESGSHVEFQDNLAYTDPCLESDHLSHNKAVTVAMDCLDDRERLIVNFLFFNDPPMSLHDTGKQLGISGEAVRVAKEKAFAKMRLNHSDLIMGALGKD